MSDIAFRGHKDIMKFFYTMPFLFSHIRQLAK